ncbi:MAG: fumarylacetoacetate hydrolase family protein [Polyangiaceae bacterium]|nr:fumarylacetoacetate hydrolase family protein [Polyangiaceae bacterium]
MRIATVLHDASPDPDGTPLLPALALERDGSLYRVSALARAFGPRYKALFDEPPFHENVVALRAEPLRELDARLRAGERPSGARLVPGSFTWLPPCDADRATLFHASSYSPGGAAPTFTIASARSLLGHDTAVPVHPEEPLQVYGEVAALIAEDLERASPIEADRAVVGVTLLLRWRPGHRAQLGPVLVTRDEAPPLESLKTLFSVGSTPSQLSRAHAPTYSLAETVAWISHHVPILAGDIVTTGPLPLCSALESHSFTFDTVVSHAVDRIGRLRGRASQSPPITGWRTR